MTEQQVSAENIIRPGIQRGLDFIRPEALRKRTGVSPNNAVSFTLQELLYNALDKDSTEIRVAIGFVNQQARRNVKVIISDNGSQKFSENDIKLIVDFDNEASSKRGLLRVSRGYLGNALKCILGYAFVLGNSKTVFESKDSRYIIELQPDWRKGKINHELSVEKRKDDSFTSINVAFPDREELLSNKESLIDVLLATSFVDPDRRISYDIFGEKGVLEQITKKEQRKRHKQETSSLWYAYDQFDALVKDFCAADPQMNIRSFLTMFRGFSAKPIQNEIIEKIRQKSRNSLDVERNRKSRILPISEADTEVLFASLRGLSEPIKERFISSALGCIGKEGFKKLGEKYGWTNLRYRLKVGTHGECLELSHRYFDNANDITCDDPSHTVYPFLLEVAIFDRGRVMEKDGAFKPQDSEGPKIYYCVNFAATTHDIFREIFDIPKHLALVGLREHPVTVIAHYVSPVLYWLNYGKTSLSEE